MYIAKITAPTLSDAAREQMIANWLAQNQPTRCPTKFVDVSLHACDDRPLVKIKREPGFDATGMSPSAKESEMVRLYTSTGATLRSLSATFNMSRESVRKIMVRYGALKPDNLYQRFRESTREPSKAELEAVEFYRNNQPIRIADVAATYHVVYERLRRAIHAAGISPTPATKASLLKKKAGIIAAE